MTARTLFDKVWAAHEVVAETADTPAVLYIDLHLIHEVTSPQAFSVLQAPGAAGAAPGSHARRPWIIPRRPAPNRCSAMCRSRSMRRRSRCGSWSRMPPSSASSCSACAMRGAASCTSSVRNSGATQPGMTIVCGDSHTSTHGAFGALAFGIGTTEVGHVFATQSLAAAQAEDLCRQRRGRSCGPA